MLYNYYIMLDGELVEEIIDLKYPGGRQPKDVNEERELIRRFNDYLRKKAESKDAVKSSVQVDFLKL